MTGREENNRLSRSSGNSKKTGVYAESRFFEYFAFLKKRKPKEYFAAGNSDLTFFILVILLLCFGLVMVFSSSYIMALNDEALHEDPYFYIKKQVLFSVLGIIAMVVVSRINPDFFKEFSVLALIVSVILLIVVLFYHTTLEGRETIKRYIELPIVGQFQPSEIAKLGLIMYCAWSMERKRKLIEKDVKVLFPYLFIIALMCALIYKENHLSATVLMFFIGIAMLIFSGAKMRWFVIFGVPVLLLGIAALYIMWMVVNKPEEASRFLPESVVAWGKPTGDTPYTVIRIVAWLDKDYEPLGARWQTNNSLYAIASGGFFGKGIGNSIQKHLYLAETHNDFIFSVICEELGFIGAFAVMVLFGLLVWRGFVIAMKAKNRFGSLLVLGIVFQVGLQAAIHIAVVTDTIPNTGISLPFISYGGTSLVILLVEMGMVLSVSRSAKMRKS